jgi:hypothetical protein
MAAPIFGKKWYEHSSEHQKEANRHFEAAVASARAGSNEAVRQVILLD